MQSDNDDLEDSWDWEDLKTINKFDGYTDGILSTIGSTKIMGGSLIETMSSKATTPVSLLVESLVQQLCTMLDPDPCRSHHLYHTICEQLHQMNLIDNTYSMGEFELMRSQYQKALHQLVSIAKGQDLPPTMQSVWPLTQPIGMDWSRYYREFDEIAYIAGGGFGTVYKARHKLDDNEYAIKKIIIKSRTITRVLSHLAEVKTLASLHHINIVAYKAAWLEPLLIDPSECRGIGDTTTTTTVDSSQPTSDDSFSATSQQTVDDNKYSVDRLDETSDFIEFEHEPNDDNNMAEEPPRACDSRKVIFKYQRQNSFQFDHTQPHVQLKWATLYIQMALCQLTLRDWLDTRNKASNFDQFYREFVRESMSRKMYRRLSSDRVGDAAEKTEIDSESIGSYPKHSEVVLDVFGQLLCGLEYIHMRGIIHHDIKPSNIFVGCENGRKITVQLGDFGLACPLQDEHTKVIVGTPTYAAPEQLKGFCKPKSDIYSLGIVLLELLVGFKTDMERIKTIESVKKTKDDCKLPEQIPAQFRSLIRSMLQCHKLRPDIVQVIEMVHKIKTDSFASDVDRRMDELRTEVKSLRRKISEHESRDTEIIAKYSELKVREEELRIKDQAIDELRKKISEMELKTSALKSKDEEIHRLKQLLSSYQKESTNSSVS